MQIDASLVACLYWSVASPGFTLLTLKISRYDLHKVVRVPVFFEGRE
jgi:hypothetical protein